MTALHVLGFIAGLVVVLLALISAIRLWSSDRSPTSWQRRPTMRDWGGRLRRRSVRV